MDDDGHAIGSHEWGVVLWVLLGLAVWWGLAMVIARYWTGRRHRRRRHRHGEGKSASKPDEPGVSDPAG
jgi:hypothetical protein